MILVRRSVLAFDHAGRADNPRSEYQSRFPDVATIVVAPPMLHLATVEHGNEFQITLASVVSLNQRSAAQGDIAPKPATVTPGPRRTVEAPPVVELAIGGMHYDLEITRSAVVPLDETRDSVGIRWSEYAAVGPLLAALVEVKMVQPFAHAQIHAFEVAIVSSTAERGADRGVAGADQSRCIPRESHPIAPVVHDLAASRGGEQLEIVVTRAVAAFDHGSVMYSTFCPRI